MHFRKIIVMTQLAFLYIFYEPDDDPIESKHVTVLQKRELLFLQQNISFRLHYLLHYYNTNVPLN
jgi:hypothetical protein